MTAHLVNDDIRSLVILDRVERDGLSMADAGKPFGMSRNAVAGLLKRVRDDLAKSEAAPFPRGKGPAQKPENQDGGMPVHWWKRKDLRRVRT